MSRPVTVEVTVRRPVSEVYEYLADPRRRPEWQGSLRAVRMVDVGEPRVGMRWQDVTVVGIRPRMEITEMTRGRSWAERGRLLGITADLTLGFAAVTGGTRVTATLEVRTSLLRIPGEVLTRLAPAAVRGDLARAARAIEDRAGGH